MKKTALLLSLLLTAPCVFAGSSTGPITGVIVNRYGKLFFTAGSVTAKATCSNGEWAVDLVGPDGPAGKAMLATVLSAQAQGKSIYVGGKGNCDVWGDRETVEYIIVL